VALLTYSFEASFFRELLDRKRIRAKLIIVIGCGKTAEEAYHVQHATDAFVVGVDLEVRQRCKNSNDLQLIRCDAAALPFRNSTFDVAYSYHVLEHVKKYRTAISEMQRVMAASGMAYVGAPNKLRLVGYIAGRDTTPHNGCVSLCAGQMGAHAGFGDKEPRGLLSDRFASVENVSLDYYAGKFSKFRELWSMVFELHIELLIAQSLYYVATLQPYL
jgi:ubiquinone/menaquinone biosynthesis C-methylase UbiE